MKKILGIFMILGITYCSVADKQDEEHQEMAATDSTAKEPCDSIETTMYDPQGSPYTVKMPCDSASWPKGKVVDSVIIVK